MKSKRKKLLIINSNAMFHDGNGFYIYRETGRFLEDLSQFYEIENFHFGLPFNGNDAMANFNLKGTNIRITSIKRLSSKMLSYIMAYTIGAYRLLKVDFLYLFYPNSFSFLAIVAVILNKPFGLYIRGEKDIQSSFSKFLYRKSAFILTVSPSFTAIGSLYNNSCKTIRPMMPYSEHDIERNRKYCEKDIYTILFVGRLEYAKGVFELVDAMIGLYNKGVTNVKLTLVGDGDDADKLKLKVGESKIADCVEFKGSVFDKEVLANFYRSADLFILPTHHEGFPRVLYEAMIFGVPIITTFVGSISYIMKDGQNCFKIESKDPSDIESKISFLITNYKECSLVAKKGIETISEYLNRNGNTHQELFSKYIEKI